MIPRSRSDGSRIRLRLKRSTKTPANRPKKRVGIAVTMSDEADVQRRAGELEDQDAGGEVGQRGPDRRDQLRQPEQREVALPEDGEHRARVYRAAAGPESVRARPPRPGQPISTPSRASSSRFSSRPACAAAPPAAAVAAEGAVAGDDPMARDHEPDRVAPDCAAHRAGRAGLADHPRDLAVAGGRARRDLPDGAEDEAVPAPRDPRGRWGAASRARRSPARNASAASSAARRCAAAADSRGASARSTGAVPNRRSSRSANASAVTSWSSATSPRLVAASRIGPQGAATDDMTTRFHLVEDTGAGRSSLPLAVYSRGVCKPRRRSAPAPSCHCPSRA